MLDEEKACLLGGLLAVLSDEVLDARSVAYSASESDLALDTLSCETSICIEQCNVSV